MKYEEVARKGVLAEYLECEPEFLEVVDDDENVFEYDGAEYKVLTYEEADKQVREHIESSLWAFNADFIVSHSVMPYDQGTIELVQGYTEDKCEEANETIKSLIEDMDKFIEDAIDSDGRGHFLNSYDGSEEERVFKIYDGEYTAYGNTFCIYRVG